MEKPGTNRRWATEESQHQKAAGGKQADPGNSKHCFFAHVDAATKSDQPTELGNQWTVERSHGFAKFATNEALANTGEQIMPVAP